MTRVAEFAAGRAVEVPVPSLERELAALWRGVASEARARGDARPVVRACLWNLVVHAASAQGFERAKQLVDGVSRIVPARVLVLRADRSAATAPIAATVEANLRVDGGHAVASDEVTLAASGDSVDDLAQVVRALTVPDVPTVAVWYASSPAADHPLDRELLAVANRVVVGGESERALRGLKSVLASHRTRAHAIATSWLRAAGWRQLLASLFDPPVPAGELGAVEAVEIECAPARLGAALLVLGWLASRLGWREGRVIEKGRLEWRSPRGAAVEARVIFASDDAPDPFARVELRTPEGAYGLARHDGEVVLVTRGGVDLAWITWKQPLHFPDEAELLVAALGAAGRDRVFAEALAHVP